MGFGASTPSLAPVETVAPLPDTTDEDARKKKEKERLRLMKGRKSTILTGGAGLEDDATTEKKTLLGE